ncbi:MAG: site-specific integrase [Smithella sp.]
MSEKGSIGYRRTKSGGYYFVSWYIGKKQYKVSRYKGMLCETERMANSLLSLMRSDDENDRHGIAPFRIEKYTKQETNVIPFLLDWINTEVDPPQDEGHADNKEKKGYLAPATRKDYKNSVKNHLIPWFETHSLMLHEIQYDVLCNLLNSINREGKGKLNVMYCLHAALLYAVRSNKIQTMPEFPEKKRYNIEPTVINAIPEARQIAVIEAIPIQHQPIFWWLKYHFRRPSEAMALHKEDYDQENDAFIIRRSFSSKKLVQHTKTHKIHVIPCHPEFKQYMERRHLCVSPYFFTHETSRLEGKRYQHDFLVDLWNKAAASCGETIRMYAGLKHSSCTAFVNEQGGSVDELQMLTDHAKRDSVLKYTEVKLEAKRKIMGELPQIKCYRKGG